MLWASPTSNAPILFEVFPFQKISGFLLGAALIVPDRDSVHIDSNGCSNSLGVKTITQCGGPQSFFVAFDSEIFEGL
jgi:hypothetical protein